MAEHLELVAEIPKVEKLTVQERLGYAKKRRAQQLKWWEREKDTECGPPAPKKKPHRAKPVSFEPPIILLEAATRGDIDEVRKMLDNGMDPNLCNDDGLTALHQACIDGCEDIINLLLEYGANLDAVDRELWTSLHAATACGNQDIVEYLMEEGANIVAINADGNMPIDLADEEDDELREILETEMEEQGYTEKKLEELRVFVERRMLAELKDAVANNLDLEVTNEQEATWLHIATANAYEEVVEFLLENGASVDSRDKDGWQPIHAASVWGNEQVILMLVESGADLEAKTSTGDTPLTLSEDPDIQQFLVDLKNKVKANKVKTGRRNRSNSRSLSVKRTSLKDKITISQNEAKAEAVLRVHPQLAFLIPSAEREKLAGLDKSTEGKKIDVSPASTTGKPTQYSNTINSDTREKDIHVPRPATGAKDTESPVQNKEKESPARAKDKESPARTLDKGGSALIKERENNVRVREKENIDPNRGDRLVRETKTDTRDTEIKDTSGANSRKGEIQKPVKIPTENRPDSLDRSKPKEHRPSGSPKDRVPDSKAAGPTGITPRNTHSETKGPTSKPPVAPNVAPRKLPDKPAAHSKQPLKASGAATSALGPRTDSGGTGSLPKSTKTRHAPAPPLPRSSGSLSRNHEPSDTSGYPDSFSKRSRGSRENIVDVVATGRLVRPDPQATSVGDVKISSAGTAKWNANKPDQNNTGNYGSPKQTSNDKTGNTSHRPTEPHDRSGREDGNKNATEIPNNRILVQDQIKVEREKKSCCVLM